MKKKQPRLAAALLALAALSAHAFDLQGHRGARGLLPENTLPAFERALRIGVTTLEMDAAVTADGVVVVSHDPVLNPDIVRGPDGQWITQPLVIRHLTRAQLQAYDVGRLRPGSKYASTFSQQEPVDGTRMPTLASVFELVKRLGADQVQFDIETKMDLRNPANTLEPEPFVQALLKVIRDAGVEDRVLIQSFDWRTLQVVKAEAPKIRTVYLTTQTQRGSNLDSPVATAGFTLAQHGSVAGMVKAAGGQVWSPNFPALTADLVKQGQALDLKVIPWTVNEEADIERMLGFGVDGIISDYPDRVRAAMQRRGMPLPPALPPQALDSDNTRGWDWRRMETPVFRLGLVGFSEREEQQLRTGAEAYRQVHWRCGRTEGADAWIIKGARIARIHDNRLRVIASDGTNTGTPYLLDISSRPVAVSMPAPQQVQQFVTLFFDPAQDGSLAMALSALDAGLARLRRQYWAASHLVEHNATVGKALYELRAGAQLLAIADMKGTVFISAQATPEQFDRAAWNHRARKTVDVPPDFERHVLAELLWAYATRTGKDLLPARYREYSIYLRRPPRVAQHLIGDVHLRIIRALAADAATLAGLVERIGADEKTLARSLAALYLVGSVTTNPERAWSASDRGSLWSRSVTLDTLPNSRLEDGQPTTAPLL